jgi:hypothetical protein
MYGNLVVTSAQARFLLSSTMLSLLAVRRLARTRFLGDAPSRVNHTECALAYIPDKWLVRETAKATATAKATPMKTMSVTKSAATGPQDGRTAADKVLSGTKSKAKAAAMAVP